MPGGEILVGVHAVLEALRAGQPMNKILVARQSRRQEVEEIIRLAREDGIPVQMVPPEHVKRLSAGVPAQGVVAVASPKRYVSLDEIMQVARRQGEPALLLALDQVEDPQNLGAILRNAEAAGAHGVIIPARRSALATAAVAKASAGALAHVPLARVTNLARALDELREKGLVVVGLSAEADTVLYSLSLLNPLVLVVGGEDRGLRRLVREKCDWLASLPLRGRVNSLNAAAAAAVALYEVLRQRHHARQNSP